MIGHLFKILRKRPAPVKTIPLGELATLWLDPGEPKAIAKEGKITETRNDPCEAESPPVDLAALIGADKTPSVNSGDPWFDKKAFMATLLNYIAGRTSAFVYHGTAYYTLETVSNALNKQRRNHNHKPLTPNGVIAFFNSDSESERGLSNGKYLLRFDKGLPVKVYLYTHPLTGEKASGTTLPIDGTGRRLKSLNPIKGRTS
jgi:hypothetical protein